MVVLKKHLFPYAFTIFMRRAKLALEIRAIGCFPTRERMSVMYSVDVVKTIANVYKDHNRQSTSNSKLYSSNMLKLLLKGLAHHVILLQLILYIGVYYLIKRNRNVYSIDKD